MAKVVRCRDEGFDCEGLIRADSEEQAPAQVAEHAQAVHSLTKVSDEIV